MTADRESVTADDPTLTSPRAEELPRPAAVYEGLFAAVHRGRRRFVLLDRDWYLPREAELDPYWAAPGHWPMARRLIERLPESAARVCARIAAEVALDGWLQTRPRGPQHDAPDGRDGEAAGWHLYQAALGGHAESIVALPNVSTHTDWYSPRPLTEPEAIARTVGYAVHIALQGNCREAVAAGIQTWPGPTREYLVRWWNHCCCRLTLWAGEMNEIEV